MKGKKIEWKKDNYPLGFFICLISINIPVEKTKILTTKLSSSVKQDKKKILHSWIKVLDEDRMHNKSCHLKYRCKLKFSYNWIQTTV